MEKVHVLQLNPKYYELTKKNLKSFDIRPKGDFKIGDRIIYVYSSENSSKSDYPDLLFDITFVLESEKYLQPGYVCLATRQVRQSKGLNKYIKSQERLN
jgi:hypothetical protein